MHDVSSNFLKNFPQITPIKKVKIDNKDFYLSPIVEGFDKKIFFAKENGKFQMRVMRYSGSGGKPHVFPGYDGGRYSKGDTKWRLDYESGVIPDKRFIKAIESVNNEVKLNNSRVFRDFIRSEYISDTIETDTVQKEFKKIIAIKTKTSNSTPSLLDFRRYWKSLSEDKQRSFLENNKIEDIFGKFLKDPKSMKLDESIFGETLTFNGNYNHFKKDNKEYHEVGIGKLDGKNVYATIVHDENEPELPWVESILVEGSPITSFGIPSHRISTGMYTAKPSDYFSQIPKYMQDDIQSENPKYEFYAEDVVDIRKYIQGNPILELYKQLKDQGKLS